MTSGTLNGMFIESARTFGDAPAFRLRTPSGAWSTVSFNESLARVEAIGSGLIELGIAPGERVAILANTRLEWTLADYAALGAGTTVVPIYQTNSPGECEYILDNASCSTVFVEDATQLAKLVEIRERLPAIKHVIVFDVDGVDIEGIEGGISLADLETRGRDAGAEQWHATGAKITPSTLATMIYTSGTTGPPKGCMLTHENYVVMSEQTAAVADDLFVQGDSIILFLPLAHTFARLVEFCATRVGLELIYTSIATLMDDLAEAQPTILPSVPRVFEKAYTRILGQFNEATGPRRMLVNRAMKVGALRGRYVQHGRRVPPLLAAQHALFHKLIFSKVHARFGGNLRLCISGGAPLSKEVAEFFLAVGITILEGYGLTECTAAMTLNLPHDFRLGSVGQVMPGTEVKIASDGEILVKSKIVFQGYFNDPEGTRAVLTDDGWLHSGDIGAFDKEGFLYITDRKKDIIVTAGGKNVAPANIEGALKATPYISSALVYGDKKPYLTALITLDPDELASLAKSKDLSSDPFQLIATDEVLQIVRDAVDHVNGEVGRIEQVKRYRILPIDFTQETGELTPTLKVKRKVVCDRYGEWIEEMYGADAPDAAAITDPRIADLQDKPAVTA